MWTARKILKELIDPERRRRVLTAFWRYGDPTAIALATAQLARAMHFREDSIRKMPIEKKADLLASRMQMPEMEQPLVTALVQYHTHEVGEMLGAFLDRWGIDHKNGEITSDDHGAPTLDQVREAVRELEGRYDRSDIALYLAAAGLLMGEGWRSSTWPVVDELESRRTASRG